MVTARAFVVLALVLAALVVCESTVAADVPPVVNFQGTLSDSPEVCATTRSDGLTDGLVAYYPFNGNANDASGNGNHGTVYGATLAPDRFTFPDSAFNFDGNDYITIPNSATLQIATNQITLSAWITLAEDVIANQTRIVNKQPSAGLSWGLEIFGHGYAGSTGNQVVFHDSNGSTWHNFVSPTHLQTNRWYHLVAVDNAGLVQLYIDGVLDYTSGGGYGIPSTINHPVVIGSLWGSGYFFKGRIDDVRIYNRALTSDEIPALYCGALLQPNAYGHLLFSPLCTRDASVLTADVYNRLDLGLYGGPRDRVYLSSEGNRFAALVVDDAVHVNGLDSGLGPYLYQPGVPPFKLYVPITDNLQPEPPQEITSLIPEGKSTVLFELLDTQRTIYGNTAVYLVADCGIWLQRSGGQTTINYVTHDDQVGGFQPQFDIRYGLLSHLRTDRNFSRAACLGHFYNTPVTDTLGDPPAGNGYYYLARGLSSCVAQGYGDSSLSPDPRDALDALPPCQ